jgi:hypothetical protein
MFPETVAGPETIEKVTGSPELAVADRANGASVDRCEPIVWNVIV